MLWGRDQPKQLVFADQKGRPIGDIQIPGVPPNDGDDADNDQLPGVGAGDCEAPVFDDGVELPGVDMGGNDDPPTVEIDDVDEAQDDPAPVAEDQAQDQAPPEVVAETFDEAEAQEPAEPAVEPAVATDVPGAEAPCRSARDRSTPKSYAPSMTGTRCSCAAAQLECQGVMNPDAHMFMQEDFCQAEPDAQLLQ